MTLSIEEREAINRHINELPEIEFIELLKEMAATIRRNKWEHIIDDCFEIETFENEIEEANGEIAQLKHDLQSERDTLNKIRQIL